jgi:hypothetical protein
MGGEKIWGVERKDQTKWNAPKIEDLLKNQPKNYKPTCICGEDKKINQQKTLELVDLSFIPLYICGFFMPTHVFHKAMTYCFPGSYSQMQRLD